MRLLIVEDEPQTRSNLTCLCQQQPDLQIVARASTGASAIAATLEHRPEVLLLDVELQDMSGFQVLSALRPASEPLAIMVTAQPQNALQAFEANALDCLPKPVDRQRFNSAISRARDRLHSDRLVVRDIPRHLTGEKGHKLYFIPIESIDSITADGNYVQIHAEGERYISRNTLKSLEAMLSPAGFVRIARACLINLRQVAFAEKLPGGGFEFALRSGERAASTPAFRKAILGEIYKHQRVRAE
jgi:two-component system, LytTR family, response regulator